MENNPTIIFLTVVNLVWLAGWAYAAWMLLARIARAGDRSRAGDGALLTDDEVRRDALRAWRVAVAAGATVLVIHLGGHLSTRLLGEPGLTMIAGIAALVIVAAAIVATTAPEVPLRAESGSADLTPRHWWTFCDRWWLVALAVIAAAHVGLTVAVGRSYGIPVGMGSVLVLVLTVAALSRTARPPIGPRRDADLWIRRIRSRTTVALAAGGLLLSSSAMSSVTQTDVAGLLTQAVGLALIGLPILTTPLMTQRGIPAGSVARTAG